MQPEERDPAYLWDMLQAAREVEAMMTGKDTNTFLGDKVLLRAVECSIEIIGEAARRVSTEYQNTHTEIPWREIIGQRNILAHEYGQIDHYVLYKTVKEDIPELISQLQKLLPPPDEVE
jgi:uncharacterized protein with HEPN domain